MKLSYLNHDLSINYTDIQHRGVSLREPKYHVYMNGFQLKLAIIYNIMEMFDIEPLSSAAILHSIVVSKVSPVKENCNEIF